MPLTSTQIGALAENLIANELMIESEGRLSPFQPIADDDGIDVLIHDKVTGKSAPLQIKARTNTLNKPGTHVRGNLVHFEIRKSTFRAERFSHLLGVLLDENLRKTIRAWLIPLVELEKIARNGKDKYVIRANLRTTSKDKYEKYRCDSIKVVVERLISHFEESA
jgi:hypothetical protein